MKRGFTLIELLVVIAIIALLSSVVLAALNSSRDKGGNAAVKANLSNMRSQAELYFTDNGNYTSVCGDNNISKMITAARSAGGGTSINSPCNGGASAWAAAVKLKTPENGNGYWCVDSTGSSKGMNTASYGGTVCP